MGSGISMAKGERSKACNKCRLVKPLSDFHYKTAKQNSRRTTCKQCAKERKQTEEYKRGQREYAKNRRKHETERDRQNRQCRAYGATIKGRASRLWLAARHRAKVNDLPFDLPKWYIESMLIVGVCQRTGIPFDFSRPKNGLNYNPYSPSLDQKIAGAGYVFGNVEVVCTAYNLAKNQMTNDQFVEFCKLVVNKNA